MKELLHTQNWSLITRYSLLYQDHPHLFFGGEESYPSARDAVGVHQQGWKKEWIKKAESESRVETPSIIKFV